MRSTAVIASRMAYSGSTTSSAREILGVLLLDVALSASITAERSRVAAVQ